MKTPNPDHPIRNTLKHLALAAAMAAALYFGAAPASAQTESIPIQQPSFESGTSSFLTAWPGSGFGIHGAAGGLTATVGSLMAYSNGGTVSQTLTTALLPNTEYTLKVDVGERTDILANYGNTAYTAA